MTASYPGEKDVPYIADTAPQESNLLTITQHQIRTTESSREAFFPSRTLWRRTCFISEIVPGCCSTKLSKRTLFWDALFLSFASSFSHGFLSTNTRMSQPLLRTYKMPNTELCKLCHVIRTMLRGRTIISILLFFRWGDWSLERSANLSKVTEAGQWLSQAPNPALLVTKARVPTHSATPTSWGIGNQSS